MFRESRVIGTITLCTYRLSRCVPCLTFQPGRNNSPAPTRPFHRRGGTIRRSENTTFAPCFIMLRSRHNDTIPPETCFFSRRQACTMPSHVCQGVFLHIENHSDLSSKPSNVRTPPIMNNSRGHRLLYPCNAQDTYSLERVKLL